MANKTRGIVLILLTGAVLAVTIFLPPIPQWPSYHDFADRRAFFGIPNFANMASNALFLPVAASGLWRLLAARYRPVFLDPRERLPWVVFFLGLALVVPVSAWYHLAPDSARLVWDRLIISIILMAWTAAQLTERISVRVGLMALPALLAAGMAAVFWWGMSEVRGTGDLRPYGVVHFYPILFIPLLLWLYPPGYTRSGDVFTVLGIYSVAIAAEFLDHEIYAVGQLVSGHTVKHALTALAGFWVLRMLRLRQPLESKDERLATP